MSNELEIAESNKIFECISGSRLYGFSDESSDFDYRGVFIEPKDYILGIKSIEQVEQKEPDRVLYGIKKFFQLALNNNPNIIELLYVPQKHIIYSSPIWDKIKDNAHIFLSKKSKFSFSGYSFAQLKRIKGHKKWYGDDNAIEPKLEDYVSYMELEPGDKPRIIQEGWSDLEFVGLSENGKAKFRYVRKDEYRAHHLKYEQYLQWKKNRNPKRAEIEQKFNYDLKHACHLIRLLKMGLEILTQKTIHVDREEYGDDQLFRDIRNGKYTYEKIVAIADSLEQELGVAYDKSDLRHAPDQEAASSLLVGIYEEWHNG